MPSGTITFVQVTFFLATFVNIRNISAVTDPILTKLLNLNSNIAYIQQQNKTKTTLMGFDLVSFKKVKILDWGQGDVEEKLGNNGNIALEKIRVYFLGVWFLTETSF